MSETKPQKRLVSKRQYAWLLGWKISQHTIGIFMMCLGIGGILYAALGLFASWMDARYGLPDNYRSSVVVPLMVGGLSFILFRFGMAINSEAVRANSAVAPITNRNAHLLPAQETLLRGSELPPTIQQAELLRATQAGRETPKEQLLRSPAGEE